MADPDATEKSEEDRLVTWGWALGLVLPLIGLLIALVLLTREDPRWKWMTAWAMLGVAIYAVVFVVI